MLPLEMTPSFGRAEVLEQDLKDLRRPRERVLDLAESEEDLATISHRDFAAHMTAKPALRQPTPLHQPHYVGVQLVSEGGLERAF